MVPDAESSPVHENWRVACPKASTPDENAKLIDLLKRLKKDMWRCYCTCDDCAATKVLVDDALAKAKKA